MRPSASQPPRIFGCGNPPYARNTRRPSTSMTDTPRSAGFCDAMPSHFEPLTNCVTYFQNASRACGRMATTDHVSSSRRPT